LLCVLAGRAAVFAGGSWGNRLWVLFKENGI
jgi:hypothetical protein